MHLIKVKFDKCSIKYFTDLDCDNFGLSYQQATLNMILLLIDFESTSEMIDEHNIQHLELFFAKNLFDHNELNEIQNSFKENKLLKAKLIKFIETGNYYDTTRKSFEILCSLPLENFQFDAKNIKETIEKAGKHDSLKHVMFKYVSICLEKCSDFGNIDYSFMLELSNNGSMTLK